jgi:hypothetical protein
MNHLCRCGTLIRLLPLAYIANSAKEVFRLLQGGIKLHHRLLDVANGRLRGLFIKTAGV